LSETKEPVARLKTYIKLFQKIFVMVLTNKNILHVERNQILWFVNYFNVLINLIHIILISLYEHMTYICNYHYSSIKI
jgi:hypothetical protein